MDEQTKQLMSVFSPPFKYDSRGTNILDSKGNPVLDIRGWGYLSNQLGTDGAIDVQNHLGEFIANLLNENLK